MVSPSLGLDSVNVSFLPSDDGTSVKSLPLVVSPRWDSSHEFLCNWLTANRDFVNNMMVKYGAVLVRGFAISSCTDFEQAALALQPNLNDCYRGTSPRNLQENTKYVFSAAEVPAHYPIAQHIEMSFLPAPPRQLYFSCMKAPTSAGGETALCDFRKVYQDLPIELRQKFLDKKIRYTRSHNKIGSYFSYDVSAMLGWPELFGTSDKEEVERICREEGIPMKWGGPNQDTFISEFESEPFQHHPVSKELVWFNHTQVFHWTTFPVELWYAFLRTYELRLLLHCILVSIFCIINYGILGMKMSLDSAFGDGTPISAAEMQQIRKAIHKNMVFNRWKLGDMLCIDNFAASHGRQPTYDGRRKVVVSWSDPFVKSNTVTSLDSDEDVVEVGSNLTASKVFENPQERTPESTLTDNDAQKLKTAVLEKHFSGELAAKGSYMKNPQELSEATARKTIYQRSHSQPLFHPTSDFWSKVD